jgi:hypothetical protein
MLLLIGQDVLHPVNHATTDFKEERPATNAPSTFQSPF